VKSLNNGRLPRGMKLVTLYNRRDLIQVTTSTVRHIVIMGLTLVTLVLIISGRHPNFFNRCAYHSMFASLAFAVMVLTGRIGQPHFNWRH